MSNWKLGRRHPACVTCEREFSDGETHFSLLRIEGDGIERQDVCSACWGESELAAEQGLVWWRARRRVERKGALSVDLEGLEQAFHLLADRNKTRPAELRYLIALLLLRKRRLFLVRAVVREGAELLLVRRPRRTEELPVQVFEFSPERMEELRGELARLFEGAGLDENEQEGEATSAADVSADPDLPAESAEPAEPAEQSAAD
jgi:hypothetical protein